MNQTKKIKKVDEEVQISPLRDIKITIKRTYKKEKILQKNFKNIINTNLDSFTINPGYNMVDIATQTPKLRPKNKVPEKLIFNEIKTVIKNNRMNNTVYNFNAYEVNQISNISYLGNMSNTEINEINNINMKFEKEESNNINNINDPEEGKKNKRRSKNETQGRTFICKLCEKSYNESNFFFFRR